MEKKKVIIYGAGKFAQTYFADKKYWNHLMEYIDIVGICDSDEDKQGMPIELLNQIWYVEKLEGFDIENVDAILCTVSERVFNKIKIQYKNQEKILEKLFRFDVYIRDLLFNIPTKYKLSLVLIIKNESCYVKEWIEFHKIIGVEHIYLYDNESSDNLYEIVEEYIKDGFVTYHIWDKGKIQPKVYDDAILRYKNDTKYMGFIDTDEFLFSLIDENVFDTIETIVENYEFEWIKYPEMHCGGIGVNMRLYGTSSHKEKPKGLVTENYLLRGKDDYEYNAIIKSVVNPRCVSKCGIHHMYFYQGFQCISENGVAIVEPYFRKGTSSKLRLNHYYLKSEQEFWLKYNRGWLNGEGEFDDEERKKDYLESLKEHEACNEVYDPIILKFVEKLRLKVFDEFHD